MAITINCQILLHGNLLEKWISKPGKIVESGFYSDTEFEYTQTEYLYMGYPI